MELIKKTIVIIPVVAVAVYLLWKNGTFSKARTSITAEGDIDITDETGPTYDKNNLEDVIKVAFNGDKYNALFAEKARKTYANATKTLSDKAQYQAKADGKGYTLAQMATIDGAYVECFKKQSDGTWTPKDTAHQNYFNKVVARIREM